jgi:two-component system nitrate/nitrite response regulator NarL
VTSTTVFVCESQPIVVEGIRKVLSESEDLQLVGSAASAQDGMARILDLRPTIVLLDQAGGLKTVFRLLSDLKASAPDVAPVVWASEMAEVECFRVLQVGARGIIKKTLPVTSLLECLRSVAKGNIWIENSLSNQVVGFLNRRQAPRLTPREREIVRCLCRGMRNKEIAEELKITSGTVKVHLMHIFEKTGVKDRFELAVHGRKLLGLELEDDGLTPEPESEPVA